MRWWHRLGGSWLAAFLLAAGICTSAHLDCHFGFEGEHARFGPACAVTDHVGSHAEPFEPCPGHHVLDACVTAARQATSRALPSIHASSLPAPPASVVTRSLHEPTWPTESDCSLAVRAGRAPPAA